MTGTICIFFNLHHLRSDTSTADMKMQVYSVVIVLSADPGRRKGERARE